MSTTQTQPGADSDAFGMNFEFSVQDGVLESLDSGFNQHGVREHDDGSIDVIFEAMQPGVRHEGTPHEVEITEQFLSRVAAKNYGDRLPLQFDHSQSQQANVGWVYGDRIKFSDGSLRVMAHIPATGSQIREDTISDFTHDPPAITDGSVGLDPRSIEVDTGSSRGEPAEFTDARLQEFSLTPFPAGYDDGGLSPNFSEHGEDDEDFIRDRDWGEGDLVEWRATEMMKGLVVTTDPERRVAMVTLHTEEDGELMETRFTVTAGPEDLIAYQGDAEPAEDGGGSAFSDSQLEVAKSQLRII